MCGHKERRENHFISRLIDTVEVCLGGFNRPGATGSKEYIFLLVFIALDHVVLTQGPQEVQSKLERSIK